MILDHKGDRIDNAGRISDALTRITCQYAEDKLYEDMCNGPVLGYLNRLWLPFKERIKRKPKTITFTTNTTGDNV